MASGAAEDRRMRALCVVAVVVLTGCGLELRGYGADAGGSSNDGGMDAGPPPDVDAGTDAGPGMDGGVDAGPMSMPDAGFDGGFDAGTDAGPPAVTECTPGMPCACSGMCRCNGGGCTFVCQADCQIECPAGGCAVDCTGGASPLTCDIACGGGCNTDCGRVGARCTYTTCAGGCVYRDCDQAEEAAGGGCFCPSGRCVCSGDC